MSATNSILDSTKLQLGIQPDFFPFDEQIITDINTAFSVLNQLGIGPEEGFSISDNSTTWDEYTTDINLNMIKTYMGMKVRVMFDPPVSSFALDSLNKQIAEFEWRMQILCDKSEVKNNV